jgi:hypothetical protein
MICRNLEIIGRDLKINLWICIANALLLLAILVKLCAGSF